MARDNPTGRCGSCVTAARRTNTDRPPVMPAEFWAHPAMVEALASRHMGKIIRAWRTHPAHGSNIVSQDRVATWAGITQPRISRIENGPPIQHLDQLIYWAALLAIPPERLWFSLPPTAMAPGGQGSGPAQPAIPGWGISGLLDDVDRRELLRLSAIVGGLAAANPVVVAGDLFAQSPGAEIPAHVGQPDIEEIQRAARSVSDWSFALGGAPALRAGYGHLQWAVDLARTATCPARLRPDLHAAVSRLADACGFAAFDSGNHSQARFLFATAHSHAEAAEDWPLRASALADRALLEAWVDAPDTALIYCELALVGAERLAPVEQAMVWATKARVHAHTGDTAATLTAIGTADDHHANTSDDHASPLTYYTAAEHAGTCGHALYTLAITNPTPPAAAEATRRLETAAVGYGDTYARSRAHTTLQLATITMLTGDDPDHAANDALTVLDLATPIRSTRTQIYLNTLHQATAPHSNRPLIAELRHRSTTLQTATPGPTPPIS